MGYYTPDWIHIRSEWDFFFLPLAAFSLVFVLGVLFFVYPRRFPKDAARRIALMTSAVVGACALLLYAFLQRGWASHAVDFLSLGKGTPEILADLAEYTGFPLPPETTVSVAAMFGSREYTFWYATQTDAAKVQQELRELNYEAVSLKQPAFSDQLQPELLTRWIRQSGFSPTLIFRKQTSETFVTACVDQSRNLALFVVNDF